MSVNEFLEIRYDAFPYNEDVEDFNNIECFKEELNKNYNNIVKANPVGRGGEAYELIIHFTCNLDFLYYLTHIVIIYLGGKIIDKVVDKSLEKYLFIPLKNAYQKLKYENPILDCFSFQIEFKDINIFIYKTSENSVFSSIDEILKKVANHFKNIETIENFKTTEIHVPVVPDIVDGQKIYRVPLGSEETITTLSDKDYFNFWGVKYCHNQLSTIYDLNKKSILSNYNFYTEQEFQVIFDKSI